MFPAMSRCPEPFVRQPLSGLEEYLEREGQSTEHLEILRRTIWGQRLCALALGYLTVFSLAHQEVKTLLDRSRQITPFLSCYYPLPRENSPTNREDNLVHLRVICEPENAADKIKYPGFLLNNFYTTMTSEGLVSIPGSAED